MTYLQLFQFVMMLGYLVMIFNCQKQRALTIFFLANVSIFLFLFGDFFRKTYGKSNLKNKITLKSLKSQNIDENNNINKNATLKEE